MAACEEIGRRREPTACGWGLGLPLRVVRAGPVESLVRVPAKEVALRLHQCSSRQPRLAQRVVVREAAREGGGWDARLDRAHHGAPPSCLPHLQLVAEVLVEQDGVGGGLEAAERDAYLVEHGRADDAAPLPDARKLGQLDLPALGVRRRLDEGEALRVGAELARIESILEVVYETAAPLHQRPANPVLFASLLWLFVLLVLVIVVAIPLLLLLLVTTAFIIIIIVIAVVIVIVYMRAPNPPSLGIQLHTSARAPRASHTIGEKARRVATAGRKCRRSAARCLALMREER